MPNKYLDDAGLAEYTSLIKAELATKADLASPALTGTPTAPTPTAGDDSTKIATTAYVQDEVANYLPLTGGSVTGNLSVSGTITGNVTGNATNDGNGNPIASTYLPLAGGTLTGALNMNSNALNLGSGNSDNGRIYNINNVLRLVGGSNTNTGSYLDLGTPSASNQGFALVAKNSSNSTTLSGSPSGTLSWGGDINLGGEITLSTSGRLKQNNSTSYTGICGGTAYSDGGNVYFFGKDNSDASLAGAFRITAHDGTNAPQLLGKPNGTLTWGGKTVIVGNTYTQTFSNVSVNANANKLAGTLTYDPTYYSVKVSGSGYADISAIVNTSNGNVYIRNMGGSNLTGITIVVNYIVV